MRDRWGMVALIDMLKEAILRTGCLGLVGELARSARLSAGDARKRLLLVIYGYGTNGTFAQTTQLTDLQREIYSATSVTPPPRLTALTPA